MPSPPRRAGSVIKSLSSLINACDSWEEALTDDILKGFK